MKKKSIRKGRRSRNRAYEQVFVSHERKIYKIFFVPFYILLSGVTCDVCRTLCEGFQHQVRVITIWNARTKEPILGASPIGQAVEERLNNILMSGIVVCKSHIGDIEERRRMRYHLPRDVST